MAQQMNNNGNALVPLRKWIEGEAKEQISAQQIAGLEEKKRHRKEMILRKTIIAYGIAELLRHARDHPNQNQDTSPLSLAEQFVIDNFVIRVSHEASAASAGVVGQISRPSWNDTKGVDMISPGRSVLIAEPSFLCGSFSDGSDGQDQEEMGRYLEVEFPTLESANGTPAAVSQSEEDARCHSLGVLLYELFSQLSMHPTGGFGGATFSNKGSTASLNTLKEPAHKKARLLDSTVPCVEEISSSTPEVEGSIDKPHAAKAPHVPLIELGFPSSICLLVQNLLECGEEHRPDNAYDSLETVIKDLHLLLLDPNRFLFDQEPTTEAGCIQLSFRENKLYGRENEVSLITDAFCRVSSGKSEAFFIGGFSGSGKSMLVNSLKARVDMAEGYVLIHKFDQMSKERPLLEVISVFNELCFIIKERSSQQNLLAIVKGLMEVFEMDFSVLARLLPNIEALSPQLKPSADEKESGDQTNLRSICFTLQRFMRVVSTKSHPVMLFLDDLQWCDNSALTVVEGILSDAIGLSCLFFVGSYRSNEVADDHAIFPFMDSLRSSGVPTTNLSLEGLNPEDLKSMVSDAICMFPRICEPLSDIVFQKTKGNPFFVLAFLRSLVDGGLLEYSAEKRRWVWDEDLISSMDITGNVLYLLSSKMSGLSENIQSALKVAACFGIKIKESVVGHLSSDPEYSNIRDGLEQVVKEGFMIKVRNEFKFVHDKVREAAYSLILDSEKNQYHYSLGMSLYSISKGKDVDDIIFSIADQVNHGKDNLPTESSELRADIAELNQKAGAKAVDCSDYVTARSYLSTALTLSPAKHWKSRYDQSLQLSFLLAKSYYSCGDVEKARGTLQEILEESRCIEDKLPAYFLLVTILNACGEGMDAYSTCHEVLCQLGEVIPNSLNPKQTTRMIETTSKSVDSISDTDLLEMKDMDEQVRISLKFYSLMATVAFIAKPEMFPYLACRMVQLTKTHGLCKYSIMGLVQFAAMLCGNKPVKNIDGASRIGKAAMSCWKKRFYSAEQLPNLNFAYYGFVAFHTEPLQSCADMLRQGFDSGMSLGESETAFFNALQHVTASLFAGEKLSTLLEKVDYYLELTELYKNELAKTYLSIFRDTISTLIDKGESTSAKGNSNDVTEENAMKNANSSEAMYSHRAIQAYWLGHSERCHHYIGKVLQASRVAGGLGSIVIMFIYGLNSFQVLKRQNTAKNRMISSGTLATLKIAASHSRWNFRNKVHLLEAELFSFQGNHEEAKASYAAAIASARCSRFNHEQGLACELAGLHCKKIGDNRSAWSFFNQAKKCYKDWGSQMKVDSITRRLESFQAA